MQSATLTKTYVPPRGPLDAKIMVIGEAPGSDEVRLRKPFVGYSGMELANMLHEAGLLESECFITNVLRFQPPGNDEEYYISAKKKHSHGRVQIADRYVRPEVVEHLEHLRKEIEAIKPNLIIAFGDLALWATTGESGILKWRGSVLPGTHGSKVVPTLHPAYILRFWAARNVVVQDLRRAKMESETPELFEPEFDFLVRPSFTEATQALDTTLETLSGAPAHISCDLETRGGHTACIGFGFSPTRAICIPLMSIGQSDGYWPEQEEFEIVKRLIQILSHPNAKISGQNFMYDAQYLAKWWGVLPQLWWDTMNVQHVLFPDLPASLKPKSLGFLASMYCRHPRFWKDEGKLWDPKKTNEEQLWEYNCKDAVYTWEIAEAQQGIVKAMHLEEPVAFQMALWRPLVVMMLRGIAQDVRARQELSEEIHKYTDTLQKRIDYIAGHPVNIRSAPQMKTLLYNDLRIKEYKNRKTGNTTVDDETLEKIGRREPLLKTFTQAIQHLRSASVFQNTFIDMELSEDQRVRCSFNMARAKTLRLTSSEDAFGAGANLQNQPRSNVARKVWEAGGELTSEQLATLLGESKQKAINLLKDAIDDGYITREGDRFICIYALPDVRKLFIPDSGYTIIDCDLDRADLQVVVWEAGDEILKQMLREGVDIHIENARTIGLSRDDGKIFVHATDYGASPRRLAMAMGKTVHEMELAQNRWFAAHPKIREWQRRIESGLPKVSNKFGFSIHFFDRKDALLPKALAWVPQSTVAIVINKGLVRLAKELPMIEHLLQVHDSLVFQIKHEDVNTLLPLAMEKLLVTIPYDDPLVIPVSAKASPTSWGDVTKWKPTSPIAIN